MRSNWYLLPKDMPYTASGETSFQSSTLQSDSTKYLKTPLVEVKSLFRVQGFSCKVAERRPYQHFSDDRNDQPRIQWIGPMYILTFVFRRVSGYCVTIALEGLWTFNTLHILKSQYYSEHDRTSLFLSKNMSHWSSIADCWICMWVFNGLAILVRRRDNWSYCEKLHVTQNAWKDFEDTQMPISSLCLVYSRHVADSRIRPCSIYLWHEMNRMAMWEKPQCPIIEVEQASKQFVACAYPSMMPPTPVDALQWWCIRGSWHPRPWTSRPHAAVKPGGCVGGCET